MCHRIYLLALKQRLLFVSTLELRLTWSRRPRMNIRRRIQTSELPAHLVKEAVGLGHSVELVFVLLQEIHVALLWNKLQQLKEQEEALYTFRFFFFTSQTAAQVSSIRLCSYAVPVPACLLEGPHVRPLLEWLSWSPRWKASNCSLKTNT